jgi:methylmalonyl-CoA carboxyltransferase large subunit
MTDPTLADVLAAVQSLSARVEALEAELASVRADLPPKEVPEEVVIAISAAVAAFLGHRARLKQVRYRTAGDAWTQQGRAAVHRRDVLHGVR